MSDDKKHTANSGCMPDGGPCEICDEPAPAQELNLDALEERTNRSLAYAGEVIEIRKADVLALIARVREAEADRDKWARKFLVEFQRGEGLDAYVAEKYRRCEAAEQLLRDRPKLELYVSQEDVGEEIRLSDFHDYKAWHGLVAEFLKPKAGGT